MQPILNRTPKELSRAETQRHKGIRSDDRIRWGITMEDLLRQVRIHFRGNSVGCKSINQQFLEKLESGLEISLKKKDKYL